jgi:hypothetical protein
LEAVSGCPWFFLTLSKILNVMKGDAEEKIKKKTAEIHRELTESEQIELRDFAKHLESLPTQVEKILAFRGFLDKVEDAELIKELTVDLPKTRLKGNNPNREIF